MAREIWKSKSGDCLKCRSTDNDIRPQNIAKLGNAVYQCKCNSSFCWWMRYWATRPGKKADKSSIGLGHEKTGNMVLQLKVLGKGKRRTENNNELSCSWWTSQAWNRRSQRARKMWCVCIVRPRGLSACNHIGSSDTTSSRGSTIPYLDNRSATPVAHSQGGTHRSKVSVGP